MIVWIHTILRTKGLLLNFNKKTKKQLFLNILVFIISIVLSLFAAEIILRVLDSTNIKMVWDYAEVETPKTHWDEAEDAVVEKSTFNGMVLEGEVYSLGLRENTSYPLNTDKYRILAVGDSFTYGFKLTNESSWPELTEDFLVKAGWNNIEILNSGRPGTDTHFQSEFFKKYTSQYNPDMVVIGFIINDCTTLCSSCGTVELKETIDKINRYKRNPYASRLLTTLQLVYYKNILSKMTIHDYFESYEDDSKEFRLCREAFLNFKKLSEEMNFKLIVFIYPMLYELNEGHPFFPIHNKMLDFFAANGILAHDLTPAFFGQNDTDLWVQSSDSHPDREANTIAAKKIASVLASYLPASAKA